MTRAQNLLKPFRPILFIITLLATGIPASSGHAESPLSLMIDNQTYFYNQERGRELDVDLDARGFTLTGNLTQVFFRYKIGDRVRLDAGVFLDIPFGEEDRVDSTDPILSLKFGFSEGWMFTAGTIDRNHPLHDAFFDDNLRYLDPIEQGFQLQADTRHLRQDLWISWEERETATKREKFSIGNYTQVKGGGFMIDGQVYWVHLGGQANNGPGVFNNLSLGGGIGYTYRPKGASSFLGFLDEIGVTGHYLVNSDSPPGKPTVDDEGIALRGFVSVLDTYLYYLHWRGGSRDFNSPRGDTAQPNVALAKGDPLYRAKIFDEVGVVKSFELSDEVLATVDYRAQFLLGRFAHILAFNVTWRPSFELFEDYFKNRTRPTETINPPIGGRPHGF